jgi:group I intron endonuclease
MSAIIYLLTNTVNGKTYVGVTTKGLDVRWAQHYNAANRNSSVYLHRAIRKYGKDAFIQEIVEETTVEEMYLREQYWIGKLNPQYNMTLGGEGTLGLIPDADTRYKMSMSHKGRVFTAEHRHKLSMSRIGKRHSEQTRNKLKVKRRNRVTKPETKEKLREAFSGNKNPNYGKTGKQHPAFGRLRSEETRRKISEAALIREKRRRIMRNIIAPEITVLV